MINQYLNEWKNIANLPYNPVISVISLKNSIDQLNKSTLKPAVFYLDVNDIKLYRLTAKNRKEWAEWMPYFASYTREIRIHYININPASPAYNNNLVLRQSIYWLIYEWDENNSLIYTQAFV